MDAEKRLGKIARIRVGFDADRNRFGLYVHLSGDRWGANDFTGGEAAAFPTDGSNAGDYVEERADDFASAMDFAAELCTDAGVLGVDELRGKPVVATFQNGELQTWRIATEAI